MRYNEALYIVSSSFLLSALFSKYKILFPALIVRRRGDLATHQASRRATSLTITNQVKGKCFKCAARPAQ